MRTLPFSFLDLDAQRTEPLYWQLYEEMRLAILDGRIPLGQRLPATRMLAKELRVSRNTVLNAFDQLYAEGYLEGRHGSGTFVTATLPDSYFAGVSKGVQTAAVQQPVAHPFVVPAEYTVQPFKPGVPDLENFPLEAWVRLVRKAWRLPATALLGYGRSAGYTPLCRAIAEYLKSARGVQCEPEQVIVVSGSQQGLDLIARVLLHQGDAVWMEEPGYIGARLCFQQAGAKLYPVPVDEEGMDVEAGKQQCLSARLAFVTPSHQYPLGATMSLSRRMALLDWAEAQKAWIVEDDYDSEYRYAGRPLASLQGLDRHNRVIYLGTFSKVLFPALRLAYLVVPPEQVEAFTLAKALLDQHSSVIDQVVLAEFIESGQFSRHLRRMRMIYAERQALFLKTAQQVLGDRLMVMPDEAGMHLMGWLPEGQDDVRVAERLKQAGILTHPLSRFTLTDYPRQGLLLGYAAFSPQQIREGIKCLVHPLASQSDPS